MLTKSPGPCITMSRGRRIDLSGPHYYQDLLTGIAQEILQELAELEKVNLANLEGELLEQVVGITQIRLLNELYFALGQLRAQGVELDVKQAIQDLRDIWNRYIDGTDRPDILKFHEEEGGSPVQ
uniref:Uncharacterized protein n=1 Tax=Desulfobacca acetoxidans TaxID=60893 RepID=A0A7C3ZAY1_9BACT